MVKGKKQEMVDKSKVDKLLGAAGALGSGTILKAIGKIAPGIGSFVSGAYTAGYAADQIIDFIRDKMTTGAEKRNLSQLSTRESQGTQRPDERAELAEFRQKRRPFENVSGLAKLGAQGISGLATARSSAAAQELEREQQQAILDQKLQEQKGREEEAAFRRERELELQNENTRYKKSAEDRAIAKEQREIERNHSTEQRELAAAQRAIEKHKANLARGSKSNSRNNAAEFKATGKPPETYVDALHELDELINFAKGIQR